MKRTFFLGVDPGSSGGGMAALTSDGVIGTAYSSPMPETERDIWQWFRSYAEADFSPPWKVFAIIEKVHSMPGQGVSSTFKFGVNYGLLRMALISLCIPFEEVTPQTWQKGLGIRSRKKGETDTSWKNHLKGKAQQLFPSTDITLKTADALLIAEYCRRKHEGRL